MKKTESETVKNENSMLSRRHPLLSRAAEKYSMSEYAVSVTDFLTPGEKTEIYASIASNSVNGASRCFFWGGCRGVERCTAVFLPEWYMPEKCPAHKMPYDEERTDFFASYLEQNPHIAEEIPICAVRIKGSGFSKLEHRDYMGALLSLGIERSVIGDIVVVSENEAIVFILEKIAPFIVSELKKIGHDGVSCEKTNVSPNFSVQRKYENMTLFVSSLRLDGVVKALTGKSREEAALMVKEGLVNVTYRETDNVSLPVKEDDVISVRGYGKFVIGKTSGTTKSDRLRVECKKYI